MCSHLFHLFDWKTAAFDDYSNNLLNKIKLVPTIDFICVTIKTGKAIDNAKGNAVENLFDPKENACFTPNVWTFVWEVVTPNVPKGH